MQHSRSLSCVKIYFIVASVKLEIPLSHYFTDNPSIYFVFVWFCDGSDCISSWSLCIFIQWIIWRFNKMILYQPSFRICIHIAIDHEATVSSSWSNTVNTRIFHSKFHDIGTIHSFIRTTLCCKLSCERNTLLISVCLKRKRKS